MARNNNIITAIDIGSDYIKGIVARKKREREEIEVLSQISVMAEGIRRGVITDVDAIADKINHILIKMRGEVRPHKIKEIYINIGGSHVISRNSYGAVAISRADQKVSPEDTDRVLEEARAIDLSSNQEVLDIFAKEFIVDGEAGLKDVIGMKGIKLEVNALALCVFSPYLKKLIDAVLSSGIEEIAQIIPSPLASAQAVLTPQQKELGVVMVDIGAQTTGIAVFEEKNLIHLAILPIGSANISRDIAIALQADVEVAEQIKRKFGSYIFQNKTKKEKININKEASFVFDSQKLVKAGRARVMEIFGLVNKELKKINRQGALPAGVVLTGGGAKLPGIVSFAKKELQLPAQKGAPKGFIGLEQDPGLSVLCGLVLRGIEIEEQGANDSILRKGIWARIREIVRTFIP